MAKTEPTKTEPIYERLAPGDVYIIERNKDGSFLVIENRGGCAIAHTISTDAPHPGSVVACDTPPYCNRCGARNKSVVLMSKGKNVGAFGTYCGCVSRLLADGWNYDRT